MSDFDMSTVHALPEVEAVSTREEREFLARGRQWKITVRTNIRDDAELWFACMEALAEANLNPKPVTIILPGDADHPPVPLRLTNPRYISSLKVLATVTIAPALSFEDWVILGKRLGGPFIQEVFEWAVQACGLTEEEVETAVNDAKNS